MICTEKSKGVKWIDLRRQTQKKFLKETKIFKKASKIKKEHLFIWWRGGGERKTDRSPICWFTPQMLPLVRAGPKLETENSSQVHMGGKTQGLEPPSAALQGLQWQDTGVRSWRWEWNPARHSSVGHRHCSGHLNCWATHLPCPCHFEAVSAEYDSFYSMFFCIPVMTQNQRLGGIPGVSQGGANKQLNSYFKRDHYICVLKCKEPTRSTFLGDHR